MEEALEIKMPETDSCKEMMRKRQYYINKESYDCPSNKHLVPTQINVFTDGSKTLRGVGCGFAIYTEGKIIAEDCLPLNPECTVFQAELEAIHLAANYLNAIRERLKVKYVKFFSDSQSSLQALDSIKISSKTVLKTAQALNRLGVKNKKNDVMLDQGPCRTHG